MMDVIIKRRRGGKTTALLNEMKYFPESVLVCFSESEADRLRKENPDMSPKQFVSGPSVMGGILRGRNPEPLLFIDNADLVLRSIFHHPIQAVTFTED
jgi:hypothetical protein